MTALRQRMLEDMQVRQLSPHTQRAYIANVAVCSPLRPIPRCVRP